MTGKIERSLLYQYWIHSHEEDTANEAVYRPESYDFPPARGRKAFELREDGTLVDYGSGPADRPIGREGQWKLVREDQVAFSRTSADEPSRVLTIRSLDAERLVLEK